MIARIVAEQIKLAGQICSNFSLMPVAGDMVAHAALAQEYMCAPKLVPLPNRVDRVAQILTKFEIPGVDKMDLQTVLRVRKNEDTFASFRRDFGQLIERVHLEEPDDQAKFEKEFIQAADDLLAPRVEELKRVHAIPFFDKVLLPGALPIGAGAVALQFMGVPSFPPTAVATVGLAPVGWVAAKLFARYTKKGIKAGILRDEYAVLLEKA
jgi:hypothetical protein